MKTKNDLNLKQNILLFLNRIRWNYRVQRDGKFFKIIVPEKHKLIIKSLKYFLTIISLISAFFAFQIVFISFLFGLVIFGILWLFEKVIFLYSTFYVPPLPIFEIDPLKWLGTTWGYGIIPNKDIEIPIVGILFSDENYAQDMFSLLLDWSYGESNDKENNICLSAIVNDDKTEYVFFCYPNIFRRKAKEFFKKVDSKIPKGYAPSHNFVMQILRRNCLIPKGSYFPIFRN